jgi:uncharacterized protein YqeY
VTIAEKLTEDMKESMRRSDSARTGVVRLLRGAIRNDEINGGHVLSDEEAMKVLVREAKQRRDSIDAYRNANREDLASREEAELAVISEYLPKALSEEDVKKLVNDATAELGATDMKQMGAVIGVVMKKAGASADGGVISKLVREKLSQ